MARTSIVDKDYLSYTKYRRKTISGAWTAWSESSKTVPLRTEEITRDDIHMSSVLSGFRPPLAYSAGGYTADMPAYSCVGSFQADPSTSLYEFDLGGYLIGEPLGTPVLKDLISAGDISRATINLLRAVGDSKWSAGEMLAEMQGSIDMIEKSARKLQNALLAASRKNWRGVAKALGVPPKKVKSGSSSAQAWLEYQFGWAPVVSDIANAATFLGGGFDGSNPPILMARTKLYQSATTVLNGITTLSWSIASVQCPWRQSTTLSDEWKASVYFKMNLDMLRGLTQYGIVGLSTPWAVLPQSYLVDWILPIGDYLEALDALIGLTYLGGSYTRFKKQSASRTYGSWTGRQAGKWIISGAAVVNPVNRFDMKRIPWGTPPIAPPLYVKSPFDTFKAVTTVALLKQFSSKQ